MLFCADKKLKFIYLHTLLAMLLARYGSRNETVVIYAHEICVKIHSNLIYISHMIFSERTRVLINVIELSKVLQRTGISPSYCSSTLTKHHIAIRHTGPATDLWSAMCSIDIRTHAFYDVVRPTDEIAAMLARVDGMLY